MTSKILVVLLMLVVFTVTDGSIVSIDFETSEGYPAIYPTDGTKVYLTDHGWYDGTTAWYVPYTNSSNPADAFSYSGTRSAKVTAAYIQQEWCSYAVPWTASGTETTVSYSSHIAFQVYPYAIGSTKSYGGIVLRGKKANATEVTLGGIQLRADGIVTSWGYPDGTYTAITSSYTYSLDRWYQLEIRADFQKNIVQFLVDGNVAGYCSFGSDVVELNSIGLYCGSNDKWSLHFIRFDTITVNVSELSCPWADLNGDCFVDMEDFALLAANWLSNDCVTPDWCNGADIDSSGAVDFGDLAEAATQWLTGVRP